MWFNEKEDGLPKLLCPLCTKQSCIVCQSIPYHINQTCQEYQKQKQTLNSDEILNMKFLNSLDVRYCMMCHHGITKSSGCNKMKCRCGYKFCFKCNAANASCRCTPSYHGFWDNQINSADI